MNFFIFYDIIQIFLSNDIIHLFARDLKVVESLGQNDDKNLKFLVTRDIHC